ncbi:hypothetical protein MIMGU_mgv1a002740mg [Erythranthe guttata]|uniref:HAT C-terminal dimerisation domain-containing protein n=1 Tax=Erythranthe guttata TaxID=4155 RepID=A0A022Q4V7_ERYGU|nr:hypothetical protein MIMGU_mgv1a002740mg [Erythranthe guttata]
MDVASSVSSRSSNEADDFTYSQKRMEIEFARLIIVEGLDFSFGEKLAFVRFAGVASSPYILAYSHEVMVKEITRLIFTEGLHLNFGERPAFVQFVKKALNPNYREVTKSEVLTEGKKEFANMMKELRSIFASPSRRVSLALDVWRKEGGFTYVRVTAHWMDSDWSMQRRIIGFKPLEFPISGANVSDPIKSFIEAWAINDKISSVTVDDVTDCADAVGDLKNFIHPILDGKLFRVRCVCRVLSSCILEGLKVVRRHINKIRGFDFPLDDSIGWDDTREMLKRSVHYKDVVNEYIATRPPDSKFKEINEHDWEVVSVYIRFLDVFYEAVDFVSRNYYPSSSGVLLHLVNIAKLFSEYRGKNFLKHYGRIPDLFSLAAVMDPRLKLSGCECLIESYYQCMNKMEVNVEQEKKQVSNLLHEMFNEYASNASRCGSEQPSSPELSAPLNTSGFAWSLISERKRKKTDSVFDELAFYLQAPLVFEKETGDFDILGWWKTHSVTYPVLADMARDLLTTAVSTLAPDCAFVRNEEKKIMENSRPVGFGLLEMRVCLSSWFNGDGTTRGVDDDDDVYDEWDGGAERLELSTCLRDWFNAEMRTQGVRDTATYDDDVDDDVDKDDDGDGDGDDDDVGDDDDDDECGCEFTS